MNPQPLIDGFGRKIEYLRISVTDRCDLRCTYCMAEHMTFLPKKDVLSLEELEQVANAFVVRGVKKIRITGGEPLVRRDVMTLIERLSEKLRSGPLEELTLTTNGTQLAAHAQTLAKLGVKRINVSLDTLDRDRFARLTRRDALDKVLAGIDAAHSAGLKIKINCVALKGENIDEIPDMMRWAHERGMDMTLIEIMPLGETGHDRIDQYIPLTAVRDQLEKEFTLTPEDYRTGGPSRYVRVAQTGGRLGFITPLTQNFCAGCNRVRVTCTGRIYMCLGQDNYVDLRQALRGENPEAALDKALDMAMIAKPEKHEFDISAPGQDPALPRHMSMTGG